MISKNQIQVKSLLTELSGVLLWFNQLNQASTPSDRIQCQTALAEGFTNTVRHAHKNKSADTPIEIEVVIRDESLEIRIWDQGAGFDLDQKLKEVHAVMSKSSAGGRGLVLLDRIADHLSYSRTVDDRNCLLIVKKLR